MAPKKRLTDHYRNPTPPGTVKAREGRGRPLGEKGQRGEARKEARKGTTPRGRPSSFSVPRRGRADFTGPRLPLKPPSWARPEEGPPQEQQDHFSPPPPYLSAPLSLLLLLLFLLLLRAALPLPPLPQQRQRPSRLFHARGRGRRVPPTSRPGRSEGVGLAGGDPRKPCGAPSSVYPFSCPELREREREDPPSRSPALQCACATPTAPPGPIRAPAVTPRDGRRRASRMALAPPRASDVSLAVAGRVTAPLTKWTPPTR